MGSITDNNESIREIYQELDKKLLEHEKWARSLGNIVDTSSLTPPHDFTGIDLSDFDFSNRFLRFINFTGSNLSNSVFFDSDLIGASFNNSTLVKTNFSRADMGGSCFEKATLIGTIMISANLRHVDFSGLKVDKVNFSMADLAQSMITAKSFNGCNFEKANLSWSGLKNTLFSRCNMEKFRALRTSFDSCIFDGVTFDDSQLGGSFFYNSRLTNCDLSNSDLRKSEFSNDKIINCIFKSAKAENSKLTGCIIEQSNFNGSEFKDCDFSKCYIVNSVFTECILQESIYDDAVLKKTDFTDSFMVGSSFKNTDIRSSDFVFTDMRESKVDGIKYNRRSKYRGIKVDGCVGSEFFKQFALDQAYIEDFRSSWKRKPAYFMWLIFADCGRSFTRWGITILAIILFFGWIYSRPDYLDFIPQTCLPDLSISGACDDNLKHYYHQDTLSKCRNTTWFTPYYFSFVTFTSLGFGDIVPKNLAGEIWISIEVIMGFLMLGGLISIFTNKFIRRN